MATAKELGLRRGNVVRVGTHSYEMSPYINIDGRIQHAITSGGLDMTTGPRVEILDMNEFGGARVRYLDDSMEIFRFKDSTGKKEVRPIKTSGNITNINSYFVGYILSSQFSMTVASLAQRIRNYSEAIFGRPSSAMI